MSKSKWILFIVFVLAFLFLCMILLPGCSTTKKTKSLTKTTIDSVSVVKIDSSTLKTVDSVSVKKDNTVTTTVKQDDYEKETVIEYHIVDTNKMVQVYPINAADYFQPIKRIIIKEKGIKKENIVVVANVSDSTGKKELSKIDLSKNVKTELVKTETIKTKDVKRTSYWGWLWLLIIPVIAAIGWYFGWWRWLFAWIKKRRNDDYPIKYTSHNYPKKSK